MNTNHHAAQSAWCAQVSPAWLLALNVLAKACIPLSAFKTAEQITMPSPLNTLPELTGRFGTILADPPWRFTNRTGKVAPEHQRLSRYPTMSLPEICDLPVGEHARDASHLYLWVPNALLQEGLQVMKAWGFTYKTNLVWYKVRKDGGPDGRGVGFYFRNVTELVLFGIRGKLRTGDAGRRQVNVVATRKREHSRKPDELYDLIEACSLGPYLELFARAPRPRWQQWGNEVETYLKQRKVHKGYAGGERAVA
ncbi:MAG: MT-A70 family methyltransferase [Pirellulaceae bacterium]